MKNSIKLSQCNLNVVVAVRRYPEDEIDYEDVLFNEVLVGHITGLHRDVTGINVKVKLAKSERNKNRDEDLFYFEDLVRVIDLEKEYYAKKEKASDLDNYLYDQ